MTGSGVDRPGGPSAERPDPLQMTAGEKLAAEWEARHDVAARGRSAAPGVVQRYLAGAHLDEARHRSSERHRRDRGAPTVATPGIPPAPAAGAAEWRGLSARWHRLVRSR